MIRSAFLVLSAFVLLLAAATTAHADVVRGRVLDPQQLPVARATVLLLRGTTVVATTSTDRTGTFGPVRVPAGEYDVLVSAPGLRAPARRVRVEPTGEIQFDVTLQLAAGRESVVVSAAQVDQPLTRVTDSVTVLDRSDLEARQTETALDTLRLVPGFNLVGNGGRGAVLSVFPRGGESDYTLVLVDGIALNAFGGGFDAAHLGAAGIDRIEVVRGPQSAVFGGGAIGGVVNVITRSGGPAQTDAAIEGGSLGTSRLTASTSGGRGPWSWGASFERLASEGDTSFQPALGTNVSNDDYERLAGAFSLGWSDRATRRIRVDARVGRDERGTPGPYGSDPFGLYGGIDTISRGINRPRSVAGVAVFGDPAAVRQTAQFAWSDVPSLYLSPFGDSDDRTRRVTGRYQADLDRGSLGVSAGLEIVREQADNTFVTGELFQPIPVDRVLAGFFGEGRWRLGARGGLTAGLRVERIERGALEEDPSPFVARPPLGDDVVWSVNPKISAMWFIQGDETADASSGWTKVRAGAGTGIKPPNVFDVAFTDNPSLKPERSRSVDVGVEHGFRGALVVADATYFFNRYDDLIVGIGLDLAGASRYRTDNIANARAQGIEVGVSWQSRFGLSARGTYTFLDTEVLAVDAIAGVAPPPFVVGDPLIRRPRHQGSLDVRYAHGRTHVFLLVNGRNAISDFEPNFAAAVLSNPGFAVVSAGGAFRIAGSLEAYVRVTNLLDRRYEDALGYPAPRRAAMAGLRIAVGR